MATCPACGAESPTHLATCPNEAERRAASGGWDNNITDLEPHPPEDTRAETRPEPTRREAPVMHGAGVFKTPPTTGPLARKTMRIETPDDASGDLPPGAVVGEYVVEKKVGVGGMSTVYAARHPVIGKRAALKVLAPYLSKDPSIVNRFRLEARAANKIGHPNIVDVFSFGELPDGRSYFLMEWLSGETLGARLDRGPLPVGKAADILIEIIDPLQAAHDRGIIHRDLKPDNIMLVELPNERQMVKLLDFGVAKLFQDPTAVDNTKAGFIVGTPAYVSPEQAHGDALDTRSDIYALGIMTYEMVLGERPFKAERALSLLVEQISQKPPSPRSLWPEIPAMLDRLILSMIEKDRNLRPRLRDIRAELVVLRASVSPRLKRRRDGDTVLSELPADQAKTEVHAVPTPTAIIVPGRRLANVPRWLVNAAALISVAAIALTIGLFMRTPQRSTVIQPVPAFSVAVPVEQPPPGKGPPVYAVTPEVAPATSPAPEAPANPPVTAEKPTDHEPDKPAVVVKKHPAISKPAAIAPTRPKRPDRPAAAPGTLTINARPWVRVELDGREIARETPLRASRVEAGTHTLTFTNPALNFRLQYPIQVNSGGELTLFVDAKEGVVQVK